MKKLFTLIIMAGLFLTLQAQDITNTLGADGAKFVVNENDGTSLFTVEESSSSGHVYAILGDNTNASHLISKRQLNIVREGGTAGISLYSYKASGFGSFDKMGYYHARGTITSPLTVTTSDLLGSLTWYGYNGDWGKSSAASISVGIESVSTTSTAGKISFSTASSTASTLVPHMTIESSGRVNIATVLKLTPGTAPSSPEKGDIYCNDSDNHLYFYNGTAWKQLD